MFKVSVVFILDLEHIWHLVVVFIVNFEHVITGWVAIEILFH